MDNSENKGKPSCPGECPGCSKGQASESKSSHSHKMPDHQVEGGLVGGKLALAAMISFLLPIGLAIAGSALAGPGQGRRFGGAIVGLVAGVIVAITAARVFWKDSKRQDNNLSDKEL